jgi:hypothetical protein
MDEEKSNYSLTYGGLPHGKMGSGGIADGLDTTKGLSSALQHSAEIIAKHVDETHDNGILPKEYVIGNVWEIPQNGIPRRAGECVHKSSSELGEQLHELLSGAVGSQGSIICKSVLEDDKSETKIPLPFAPSSKLSLDR